ncbi:unnamed protein product [Didymodactylos carnosus]|uniref:Uncharacterized protein n=1 Tax=Didymodactylos carnosus TaxID=1234261 RepID=A0A814I9B4_9BILA|nr:unnamed protein product [Didymodactylos carnosus]CAF1018720.1 unnamed protein product [Didymodactylos carnosus]CAF3635140.1 unnamed protein product [Didymodactylos carnosus]CAF3790222.1 unnamed protein product [Didymodactylos carnosus]
MIPRSSHRVETYGQLISPRKTYNHTTISNICEWFEVDVSDGNKNIISGRIQYHTVKKKSDLESWRKCNTQRRETDYSDVVLNKSDLYQRSEPPKSASKNFEDLEYRQKRRRLSTLNEIFLDDFSDSNNILINRLLGYLLYQRNYNDHKHLAKLGEELFNTGTVETKSSLNLDQTIALKYNLNLSTHDTDFIKSFLHEHVHIPNRNKIREFGKRLVPTINPYRDKKGIAVEQREETTVLP